MWLSGYLRKGLASTLSAVLGGICLSFFAARQWIPFYILFELSLLPTLGLVLLFGYQPEKIGAGAYLLLYTATSALALLIMLLRLTPYLAPTAPAVATGGAATLALTLAFMVKSPLYGLHLWLPKAHVEAPVAGRIVLAGVLLKLGSYGLYLVLPLLSGATLTFYLMLRVWGGVACSVLCLRQGDFKALIAYSSVVHIGVVGIGLLSGRELGRASALMMVMAHGVCSPALFRFAYVLYRGSHRRLLSNSRVGINRPLIAAAACILLGVNLGVPPFVNLWREVLIYTALLPVWYLCTPALILVALLRMAYNLFAYVRITHAKESASALGDASPLFFINSAVTCLLMTLGIGCFVYYPT